MIPEFIYLVYGKDDNDEQPVDDWVVAAYPDKETAALHADHANKLVAEGCELLANDEITEYASWCDSVSPLDPNYQNGSVDASYYVMEVPFCLHPDQFQERFSK